METITHSTTGQQALVPAKTVVALRALGAKAVEALDTLVADAHSTHPVAQAVTKAIGARAITTPTHTCHGARLVGTAKAVAERMCPAPHDA